MVEAVAPTDGTKVERESKEATHEPTVGDGEGSKVEYEHLAGEGQAGSVKPNVAQSSELNNVGGSDQGEARPVVGDPSTATRGSRNNNLGDEKSDAAMSIGSSICTSIAPIINGGQRKEEASMKLAIGLVTVRATECANGNETVSPPRDNRGNDAENDHATGLNDNAVQTSVSDEDEAPLNKVEEQVDPTSPLSFTGHESNKKRLGERLKQRLAKRNEKRGASIEKEAESPSTSIGERSTLQARLHRRQSRKNSSGKKGSYADILSKYGSDEKEFPDTVTFSDGEDDKPPNASPEKRVPYRKSVSEVGVGYSSLSSRISRTRLVNKRPVPHMHGIGILQAEGIVYDDAMLLRLARQARYNRLRGEVSTATTHAGTGAMRYNEVKLHVYDLLTKDALVEMPYFNCQFPVGQCFRSVNDACHALGTGAYHIGVEVRPRNTVTGAADRLLLYFLQVNGVEYAFGANSIIGMSGALPAHAPLLLSTSYVSMRLLFKGIFTCVPKESPGYEYRQTLDFGKVHTTKRTWIRIPKEKKILDRTISDAFGGSLDDGDNNEEGDGGQDPNEPKVLYSFREVESFADGHAVVHSMAREYLGTDYDLLRKNCCTFARDVCIRLGVEESKIPTWFHNAAETGADAEDALVRVEMGARRMLDCGVDNDNGDECLQSGFEVTFDSESNFKVTETVPIFRGRQHLSYDDESDDVRETSSWTY